MDTSQKARNAAFDLCEILGLTEDEIRADIQSRGKTAESVLREFSLMEASLARTLSAASSNLKQERDPIIQAYKVGSGGEGALFERPPPLLAIIRIMPFSCPMGDEGCPYCGRRALLDINSPPQDGDTVLASIPGEAEEEPRRLLVAFPDRLSLMPLPCAPSVKPETGHPSQLIIHGVLRLV